MYWEIHPPRALPSGNLSGLGVQNPRPREISWASGDVFPNTSLLSAVYGFNILRVRNMLGEGGTTLTGVNLHAIYTESHTPVEHI